jgi:hypothetical protein
MGEGVGKGKEEGRHNPAFYTIASWTIAASTRRSPTKQLIGTQLFSQQTALIGAQLFS